MRCSADDADIGDAALLLKFTIRCHFPRENGADFCGKNNDNHFIVGVVILSENH